MVKNQSRTIVLLTFVSLLLLVGCTFNSSKQLNSGDNASVEIDIAQANNPRIRFFVDNNGLAIRGTDPVAYFRRC